MIDEEFEDLEAGPVLEEWLTRLAEEAGETYEPDEDGVCWLGFDNEVVLALEAAEEGPLIFVTGMVVPLPDEPGDRYAIYERALTLNAFQAEVRGGALSLAPSEGLLMLSFQEDIRTLDPETLNGFVDMARATVEHVRELLGLSADLAELREDDEPGPKRPHSIKA